MLTGMMSSRRKTRLLTHTSLPDAAAVREARLRMALEAAEMVTWELDLRTNTLQYSDNLPTIVAGTKVEPYCSVAGVMQQIHPDDRQALAKALRLAARKGTPFACEYRALMQDGAYHWILGKGKTVLWERGKPVRVLGVSQEITARKRMQQELEQRTRQLAELAARLTVTEHQERKRCADLLHEDLQQILVGARLLLESMRNGDRSSIPRLDEALEQAQTVARSVTRILFPPLSIEKDLPLAMRWLVNDVRERYHLTVTLRCPPAIPPLPQSVAVLMFTAARELLLNIVKHAGVFRCSLRLRHTRAAVDLEIRDEGKGSNARAFGHARAGARFGLFSIRERAELLGGNLTVESATGQGMRVLLHLPLTGIRPAALPVRRNARASVATPPPRT